MRLAMIAGTYQPDRCGVAHYTAHLRSQLAQRGTEAIALTTHAAAQAADDATLIGAVNQWHWSELPALGRAIANSGADLLHIQHAGGTYGFDRSIFLLPLWLRAAGCTVPLVTTLHEYGWWEWQPSWLPALWVERLKTWGQHRGWWDREDGFLITHSAALITTNTKAEQVVQTRLPHLTTPMQRIPIGANVAITPIDRPTTRHQLRAQYGWAAENSIIAFFGFLHPVKGLETLLLAFQSVVNQYPQARLLVVGGVESLALPAEQASNYWYTLQKRVAQLGLTQVCQLTGYLDGESVSRHLAGVDIGVLPFNHGVTLKSGSLLALLAHRLPVVATRSTPPDPDLTQDWIKWVMLRHSKELATSLLELLLNPSVREQRGTVGYTFSQAFQWDEIADRHLTIYQAVVKAARRQER